MFISHEYFFFFHSNFIFQIFSTENRNMTFPRPFVLHQILFNVRLPLISFNVNDRMAVTSLTCSLKQGYMLRVRLPPHVKHKLQTHRVFAL